MFEVTFIIEIVVSVLYWALMKPPSCDIHDKENVAVKCFEPKLDHTLPLLTLMIDYAFNCVPFCLRHIVFLPIILVPYMLFNLIYTL